jgi:hypothetical protein
MDMIEVWNGRCSLEQNRRAEELAASLGIKTIMGSDAHCYSEMGVVLIDVDPVSWSIRESISLRSSANWTCKYSQILGYVRRGMFRELAYKGIKYLCRKETC